MRQAASSNNASTEDPSQPSPADSRSAPGEGIPQPFPESSINPDDALERDALQNAIVEIEVVDPDGIPIDSAMKAAIVRRRDSEQWRLGPGTILSDDEILLSTVEVHYGVHRLSLPRQDGDLALAVSAPGFLSRVQLINRQQLAKGHITVALQRGIPMEILIKDSEGQAIPNALVEIRGSDLGISRNAAIEEYLPSQLFYWSGVTGEDGTVLMHSPMDGSMSIVVAPPARFARVTLWNIHPEGFLEVECPLAFVVSGTVLTNPDCQLSDVRVTILRVKGGRVEQPIATMTCDSTGAYSFESLPADSYPYYALLHGDGVVPQATANFVGVPGRQYSFDFLAKRGYSGQLQLVTAWGTPISNTNLMLYDNSGKRFPYSLTTDDQGGVELPAMMTIQEAYRVSALLANYWTACGTIVLRTPGELLRHTATGIAEIGQILVTPGSEEGFSFALFPDDEKLAYCASFDQLDLPILVPAGPADLVILTKDGNSEQYSTLLDPAPSQKILIDRSAAPLTFELSDPGIERVEIVNIRNVVSSRTAGTVGMHSVILPVGQYYLTFYRLDGSAVDVGPFVHSASGTDLGILDSGAGGVIEGTVVRDTGEPVAGITVRAMGSTGYRSPSVESDGAGSYSIKGLPTGAFDVLCSASDLPGESFADQLLPVFLGANAMIGECNFVLPGKHPIRISILDPPGDPSGGFVSRSSKAEYITQLQAASFFTAESENPVSVGFWGIAEKGFWIVAQHPSVLNADFAVSGGEIRWMEFNQCDFTHKSGEVAFIRYRGDIVPCAVPSNASGITSIGTNCPEDLQIGCRTLDGQWIWKPMLQSDSPSPSPLRFHVQGPQGNSISGVSVAMRESKNQTLTNGAGDAQLYGQLGEWVWVDHPHYWARQARCAAERTVVVLLKSCTAKKLEIAAGLEVTCVSVEAEFDLGYPLPDSLNLKRSSSNTWELPVLPEGGYRIQIVDGKGELHTLRALLSAEGTDTVFINQP